VTMGEAAVYILEGKDEESNERCGGVPKWIVFGDTDHAHRIRDLAGLPHRSYLTNGLVMSALSKYAARPETKLSVVGKDKVSGWNYYGLKEVKP
jgi:hypothetical protein